MSGYNITIRCDPLMPGIGLPMGPDLLRPSGYIGIGGFIVGR